jgi:hypothetical protein
VTEDWMIDELAHAGAEHLNDAFVAGYDRKQGYPDPAEDLAAFRAHGLGAALGLVRRLPSCVACVAGVGCSPVTELGLTCRITATW